MILFAVVSAVVAFMAFRRWAGHPHASPVTYTDHETVAGFFTREMYAEGWGPFPAWTPWTGVPVSRDAYLNVPRLRLVPKS